MPSSKYRHNLEGGTDSRRARIAKKKSSSFSPLKVLVSVTIVVSFAGSGGFITIALTGPENDAIAEQYFCAAYKAGAKNLSAVELSVCQMNECEFDIASCDLPCPFGYQTAGEGEICPISCDCTTSGNYEGDIQFSEDELPIMLEKFGLSQGGGEISIFAGTVSTDSSKNKWPKNKDGRVPIPYTFDNFISGEIKEMVGKASKVFSEQTCIDFIPKTETHNKWIILSGKGTICKSNVGWKNEESQKIFLVERCANAGTVEHQFLHLLGFFHEHVHPLRDNYIKIVQKNIAKNEEINFKKLKDDDTIGFDVRYDIKSIMHFGGYFFSSSPSEPTILDRESNKPIKFQRKTMTSSDVLEVNRLYACAFKKLAPIGSSQHAMVVPLVTSTTQVASTMKPLDANFVSTTANTITASNSGIEVAKGSESSKLKGGGDWSKWTEYSHCWQTCGEKNVKRRFRTCKDKVNGCTGELVESELCPALKSCIENPSAWGEWTEHLSCSKTCDGGKRWRVRKCLESEVEDRKCIGDYFLILDCNTQPCSDSKASWGQWNKFGECNEKCLQVRDRKCTRAGKRSYECPGRTFNVGHCTTGSCAKKSSDEVSDGELLQDKAVFSSQSVSLPELCPSVERTSWLFGDFNNDKKSDVMCGHLEGGNMKVGMSRESDEVSFVESDAVLYDCGEGSKMAADFNGDSLDDILCTSDGNFLVKLLKNGEFHFGFDYTLEFCSGGQLIALDFNGDGYMDLLCWNKLKKSGNLQVKQNRLRK